MDIQIQLNKDFERALNQLKEKYGEDFEYINGVHPSQLDYSAFLSNFVGKNTLADASIDPNANANHRDIRSFMTEKGKPSDKLFALNKIFLEIKKKWGLKTAKEWLEQEFSKGFYLNDSTSASYYPYCWANDLTKLATEGLFFLNGYNNQPPKHLTTYIDDVIEFVSFLSNRQSGAVGLPNVVIWAYYFWKNDVANDYYIKSPDYYLRQSFQKFIYRLNQPFLRIDQSAFTNVSIFDRNYIEALFGGVEFPDGSFAIDQIEEIINCQKVFMEVVSEIREKESMFTYPVLTYSLLRRNDLTEDQLQEMIRTKKWDIFVDKEFARWCSDHNTKWDDSNFFVSDNVGVLSNCPLSGDTKILYWSDYYNKFSLSPIKEVYFNRLRNHANEPIKVLANGKLIECKINKFDDKAEYLITLTNGATLKTTANHLNKVYGKEYLKTSKLTTNDYLPYSLKAYKSNDYLTFEEGKLVGMFLGDGSYRNSTEITFSLHCDTNKEDIEFLKSYCSNHFGAKFNYTSCTSQLTGKNLCLNVNINSSYLRGLISQFVIGDNALNKDLDLSVLNCSIEFRKGIIEGLYATDGNKSSENCNRIYTSSEKLKDSLIVLFSSLGLVTKIYEDNRDGRLGTNPCYTIRWFTPQGRTKRKDSYILDNEYMWIKIKSIEKIKGNNLGGSYCLEVVSENVPEEFMLGNGVITHNCRLLSDTNKLNPFINSIGGTALSVGSCRVSTINLCRIAYEALGYAKNPNPTAVNKEKAKQTYLKILKDRVLLDCKALTSMRHIIKRNIEKGLLPNYQDGAVEFDKQFCTIGGIGMYEVMDLFGLIDTDEFGFKSYSEEAVKFATEILNTINEVKDNFECDFSFNVEMIPAENCAGVMCTADNLLFDQDKYFIYSNQWIPLMEKCTIQEKCRLGHLFDEKCGGGCIAHIDVENRFPNTDSAWDMLNYVAAMGVIYFAFTTKINVCEHKHASIGTTECPTCGGKIVDQFARVVGFYTPVSSYQKIRKKEFNLRKWYDVLNHNEIM